MRLLLRLSVLTLVALAGQTGAQSGGPSASSSSNVTENRIPPSASRASSASFSTTPASRVETAKPRNATCLSRTANYITHTLPQQCLRTDRTANATRSSGVDDKQTEIDLITSPGSVQTTVSTPSSQRDASRTRDRVNDEPLLASSGAEPTDSKTSDIALSTPTDSGFGTTTIIESVEESDSPLDNANFLSFEEWKRQNQAKADQAAEQPFVGDRQRPGINNALDSLGDEGEIELDFSGFGNGPASPRQQQAAYRTVEGAASAASAAAESYTPRSKDAGKTCKERTNYASFDCAATVLKTNPECKSAPSVLVENKDSYMLNTCSAKNKFFIIELCNDILIDTVVLANYEFFSSIFRHFRVSVSDRYPVKMDKWVDLGTYEARNTREIQAFLIEKPQIWTRYLRIEFLTHYGGEYYCPVSLLRVHGTTMLEDLRPEEDAVTGEDMDPQEVQKVEDVAVPLVPLEPVFDVEHAVKPAVTVNNESEASSSENSAPTVNGTTFSDVQEAAHYSDSASPGPKDAGNEVLTSVSAYQTDNLTCAVVANATQDRDTRSTQSSAHPSHKTMDLTNTVTTTYHHTTASTAVSPSSSALSTGSSTRAAQSAPTAEAPSAKLDDVADHSNTTSAISSTKSATVSMESISKSNDSQRTASPSNGDSTRSATSVTSVPPPQPSTQESFFKSIQKRLAKLEANSTLSLQYIEAQSMILRDAFSKVEKRQISATTTFLSNLNETVMAELRGFRNAYDQIWQSTVIELESQREQYQREILAISSRLTLVADELVWQKRMGIIQSTIVLLCLGLVLFGRGGASGSNYLEVPLMQQMLNRSQTALSRYTSNQEWENTPPASPSPENRSPVSAFRRKFGWRSVTEPIAGTAAAGDSGTDSRPETRDGAPFPFGKHMVDVKVQPPTPERNGVGHGSASPSLDSDHEGEDEVFEELG